MDIPRTIDTTEIEKKWYDFWLENDIFSSKPNEKEPYTIVIPPPNVTGVLHMGHMLNNTIQDVLIRLKRMQGYNACWVPGTDHASIATEAKVVKMLREQGIKKSDISREKFLEHAWEWKEKYGGIILKQLQKLGASADWNRTKFTMEDTLYRSVIKVFVDLYKKGYIFRGERLVNWDPEGKTAVSDEEVIHKDVDGGLYYINYSIKDSDEKLTIATTRPETLLGDTGICVHPDDERYQHLIGKKAIVPLVNREIPIIADDYVDREYGTGCLKVTPAHDFNDFEIGQRHNLEIINIFDDSAHLNENAKVFVGKDRFEARKLIVEELKKQEILMKTESLKHSVGFSERTDSVIEPFLSLQWFMSMEKIAKPALDNVENKNVKFIPPKFKNTYRHWMENIRDWCISRQLWWGHRIPVWYLENAEFFVAETAEEALEQAKTSTGNTELTLSDLKQDEDVLDTWFSSWLWPMSVFNGVLEPENEEFNYYYPTNDLVTAPDIIFFWVARMIMLGYEYTGKKPFENVYFTGIVRDKKGRKMSKSLGNSPDALELIEKYGADGVRVGMLLSSAAGNDLLFDVALCEQGKNFTIKIWNALRLAKSWTTDNPDETNLSAVHEWMQAKMSIALEKLDEQYSQFRISEALMTIYKLIWDDFCSSYLEMVKPAFGLGVKKSDLDQVINFFEQLMQIAHPFIPFVTEEIWSLLRERKTEVCVTISDYPNKIAFDESILKKGDAALQLVSDVRAFRAEYELSKNEKLSLEILPLKEGESIEGFEAIVQKIGKLTKVDLIKDSTKTGLSIVSGRFQCFITNDLDIELEKVIKKLEDELKYQKGFLKSVLKKLGNERFVQNAKPEIVERERMKKSDAEAKIASINWQLKALK